MNNPESIAIKIRKKVGKLKSGSLQFYGDWFGKPMDNFHTIIDADSNEDIINIYFDEGERLIVYSPSDVSIGHDIFQIKKADKIRWEWYSYGQDKTEDNKYYLEYTCENSQVTGKSNVDWYTPEFNTQAEAPAVKIT